MANLFSVPFKKTYTIPIRKGVRDYISTNHKDTHPDAFKWDIERWETLRKEATNHNVVHTNQIQPMLR